MQHPIEQPLFETLFAREYRGVLSVARRIVGPAAAEDVAQEAFAAFLHGGPPEEAHARNWLYRVAVHRSLDLLKRDRSRNERELRVARPESPPQPDEMLERREDRAIVQRALRSMKARDAAVLLLRHSGFSYREIADVVNVPVERVGVLLIRAEAALKKELNRVSPQ